MALFIQKSVDTNVQENGVTNVEISTNKDTTRTAKVKS